MESIKVQYITHVFKKEKQFYKTTLSENMCMLKRF